MLTHNRKQGIMIVVGNAVVAATDRNRIPAIKAADWSHHISSQRFLFLEEFGMNVFVLDRSMEKSAQMLDDAHLIAQINEACQILMANYNRAHYPKAKIGHVNHPVTVYYYRIDERDELVNYLKTLLFEYEYRFKKRHQNYFWCKGFRSNLTYALAYNFKNAKTYVDGQMTENIEKIREYISKKTHVWPLTWTNRERPDWWKE